MDDNTVNYLEFKLRAFEFFQLSKRSTMEQVEAGLRMLTITYLNLEGSDLELHQAALLLNLAYNTNPGA